MRGLPQLHHHTRAKFITLHLCMRKEPTISVMTHPEYFSLWMVTKKSAIQKCIDDGKLSRTKKESNYSYIGVSQDREKAVDDANNHMANYGIIVE